jgi:phosphoribosylglycinamide formyltransferase-1
MHLVTPELDRGPVVTYCTFPIRGEPFNRYWSEVEGRSLNEIKERDGEGNHLFRLIRQHGLARELPLIVATIKAFSEGKVNITHSKNVVDDEGKTIKGYNLTEEIDQLLKER